MLHVLTITAPIYLLIAVGYCSVRFGVMSKADAQVLGRFIFMFGLPALLFYSLTHREDGDGMQWGYLLAYGAGSLLSMLGMVVYARKFKGADAALAAVKGMSVAASNTAFIGFPILYQLIGPMAGVALAMCFIVENLFVMPLGLAYADSAAGSGSLGATLRRTLRSMVRNPLLWGLMLGLLFNALDWQLPAVASKAVQMVSGVAAPLALFVVGSSLVGLRLGHQLRDALVVAGTKLLLHPLLVAACLLLFPLADTRLAIAAVVYAAMPMAVIVTVLAQLHGKETFAAMALLIATLFSFITVNILLWAVVPMLA